MPSKEAILEFIQSAPGRVGRRDIARAFGVKGGDRIELKRLLKEMSEEGLISGPRKRIMEAGALPPVAVIVVTGLTADGEPLAEPASWNANEAGEAPKILVLPDRRQPGTAPGIGDRLLARLERLGPEDRPADAPGVSYEARPIRRLDRERMSVLGVFRALAGGRGLIEPIDRKRLREWSVREGDTGGAADGELVRFEMSSRGRYGLTRVRIVERLGDPEAQGAISLIAIHEHGLRDAFPTPLLAEAEQLEVPIPEGREDLRPLPLITIDPEDARDHDDAVFAEPDADPANPGGWVVIVAIADVAWFVRPGAALDREALLRGNSVYFPDRVVPMLPERVSNDLCSLREGEDRACLAVRMIFDADGNKKSHRFVRGIMRSAARLSYTQAQRAIDGQTDDTTGPLLEPVLKPLWRAYGALARARDARGPLALELPERKVLLDETGQVSDIVVPARLDAHRLIEEFMIQANVAAAETLEGKRSPLLYRVHDAPAKEKIVTLGDFLATLDIALPTSGRLQPSQFNTILARVSGTGLADLVNEVILRAQTQAEYSPANAGHFGLNLRRYAHFTSPIRRYADLIVHRALIRALGLGAGGLSDDEIAELERTAEAISNAERVAMAAERQTVDRLVAGFLAERIGATFTARVSGLVRTGLFVRLETTGADGFVAASSMLGDFYHHDEALQALIGERTGLAYRLGDTVEVRLVEVIPSAGAIRFEMLSDGVPLPKGTRTKGRTPARRPGRPPHRRGGKRRRR